MKKVILYLVLILLNASALAQKVYFIYLQSDKQQPFYARMGDKIYNSSRAGYLIISNLRDSTYSINIGIQGSNSADKPFTFLVNKKDQGYLVKDFGEKGMGLFNLQTMAVVMPVSELTPVVSAIKTEKREDNAFTNLLAKAADDSTIKERPVIPKVEEKKAEVVLLPEEKKIETKKESKPDTVTEVSRIDTAAKMITQPVEVVADKKVSVTEGNKAESKSDSDSLKNSLKPEEKKLEPDNKDESTKDITDSVKSEEREWTKSSVALKSESSTTEGIGLVFLDKLNDGNTDTIKILIPVQAIKMIKPAETVKEEKKFLDMVSVDSTQQTQINTVIKNTNCSQLATDDDFFRVRKKMASEDNDEKMIEEARKIFRVKCFSTAQIKNLSTLFLTDNGKYKFFDIAYSYVSDQGNFQSLQSELKEEYFINRFRAMLRQ
jgi:hypothetical protein